MTGTSLPLLMQGNVSMEARRESAQTTLDKLSCIVLLDRAGKFSSSADPAAIFTPCALSM